MRRRNGLRRRDAFGRDMVTTIRDVRGHGGRWPLFRIDGYGRPDVAGELVALHGGGCLLKLEPKPAWLRDHFADGRFPGIPWFLDDQRPQGFLGRLFARQRAREWGLRDDVGLWHDDDVLVALLLGGGHGAGQFVLGLASLERGLNPRPLAIPASERATRYAAMARATLAGRGVGAYVGGEQPKFTACIDDGDGVLRHVIVKFTAPIMGNPVARRWADLLITEHLASVLLGEQGIASAHSELIWSDHRLCLESTRFDRIGTCGRRGMVSLAAWSDAHDGTRDTWPMAAGRMRAGGWLTAQAVSDVERLWWFGRLIGNTDMHFGNLSWFLEDGLPLTPCPSYDMLPMAYRPGAGGRLSPTAYPLPDCTPAVAACWRRATAWSEQLWARVAMHGDISEDFRALARANGAAIQQARH